MSLPALAIHGGSGDIYPAVKENKTKQKYKNALRETLEGGYKILKNNGPALEAAMKAVCLLEDCALFNAGKGSVFNASGEHSMDAAIMEGTTLKAGAVSNINGIKNPVLLAYEVLENTPFVFLGGQEAVKFAREREFDFMPKSYFFAQMRYDQWQKVKGTGEVSLDHSTSGDKKFGTVGAVAADAEGNVAAATSTGGLVNKSWGRIGDSPVIGAGTYADNKTCAVSCTGLGEYFIRSVAAYDVACRIGYKKINLKSAAEQVIQKVKAMGGEGGLIAVNAEGNIAMPFNSEGMYRGMKNERNTVTRIF